MCGMHTSAGVLTPARFVAKWSAVDLPERAASQEHFIDLCRLLGQPTPAEHDATGAEYAFEKGVAVTGGASKGTKGDRGYADVWWRGKFGWEYKRKDKHKSLAEAYRQLLQYRESLENPPLLVVCDIGRTEIHTNFTGTAKQVHTVELAKLTEPGQLDLLRRVFADPASFQPTVTPERITLEIAGQFASLADALRKRGHDPHEVAHFLMKCVFCLFAEDVDLLPNKLFKKLLQRSHEEPEKFGQRASGLFEAMRTGGEFAMEAIPFFNGGLFDQRPPLPLNVSDVGTLLIAAGRDWASVEPSIFGTLFERSLDPGKRAQIGAHYTGREDILLVVEPVVMDPLRREWDATRGQVTKLLEDRAALVQSVGLRNVAGRDKTKLNRLNESVSTALQAFQHRLASVRVLDPACGSGNFLYVALQRLLDLEKEVINFAARPEIAMGMLPRVRPTQLRGLEINPYAAELAQVVIWIGYLQWMRDNGFVAPRNPVLDQLRTIENRDAVLDLADPRHPAPAQWPEADFVIGNPPFLGVRQFRGSGVADEYIAALHAAYDLPKTSDLCCYWFEKAQREAAGNPRLRSGLLATQGIRSTDNREVLRRITAGGGRIFAAWSNRPWTLDGAAVRVSIIAFEHNAAGAEGSAAVLDGERVDRINPDLTADSDASSAKPLPENGGLAFMGDTKGGGFELGPEEARRVVAVPNPTGRPNSDVIRAWVNAGDLTKRRRGMLIIDFGADMTMADASGYEAPFRIVEERVKPERVQNRRESYAAKWWLHVEPRPAMRAAVAPLARFIVTPRVAKHRIFVWMEARCVPDSRTFVFARADDYAFGVLHSAVHELWSLRMCSWHGVGNDPTYNTSTCFDTFPLPWPPGREDASHPAHRRIGEAAAELNQLRERWLNPPELIDPIAKRVDAEDDFADVPEDARPLIRHAAVFAVAAKDPKLKIRTLTKLYNERPTWLRLAHEKLDRAVVAAYAAVDPQGEWDEGWAELWVESGAGVALPPDHPMNAQRGEVDGKVLASLLRLNRDRSA